jgi:CRP-like cAMP-binding protein
MTDDTLAVLPGQTLLCEGATGADLFLIVEGEADVVRGGRIVATLRAGSLVGELGAFTAVRRSATVRARTMLRVRKLDIAAFDRLLATPGVGRALLRQLLQRRTNEERPRVNAPELPFGTLTSTERRVASLVARGLTNREVADELSLSHYTVQSHLKKVYPKLGVRSRVELASAGTGSLD